jgi:hypothetical protein
LVHFYFLPLQALTSNIVTILILEHACLFYASLSRPTLKNAVERAYDRYTASGTDVHDAVRKHFPAPPQEYSISEFTDFILDHRLQDCEY